VRRPALPDTDPAQPLAGGKGRVWLAPLLWAWAGGVQCWWSHFRLPVFVLRVWRGCCSGFMGGARVYYVRACVPMTGGERREVG
jgi:hypothetical protein